jgi:hypothetical protein
MQAKVKERIRKKLPARGEVVTERSVEVEEDSFYHRKLKVES